jgi:hypothetical protein
MPGSMLVYRSNGEKLTGRARFRETWWRGRLVLQVEVARRPSDPALGSMDPATRWVDATEYDLYGLREQRRRLAIEPLL